MRLPANGQLVQPLSFFCASLAIGFSLSAATFTDGNVNALLVSGNDLYAGGAFGLAGGRVVSGVAKWNGSSWSALGLGVQGTVNSLTIVGGDLYAAGVFDFAGSSVVTNIAKWNGS